MQLTDYHAKYFAHELTKRYPSDSAEKLAGGVCRCTRRPQPATAALTLEDKLAGQKHVKALEQQRNVKRRALFDAQDEIDRQRERLIAEIEGKLQQRTSIVELFKIRWRLA
jgi:adenine-specific DNA-methyltransferase